MGLLMEVHMNSKPTIVDMLYMPETADIDFDLERKDINTLKPFTTGELPDNTEQPVSESD